MEGNGLRAEGEFLVLFGLCREQLRFRLLDFILGGYLRLLPLGNVTAGGLLTDTWLF